MNKLTIENTPGPSIEILNLLREAYNNRQLIFTRSTFYKKTRSLAPMGTIFYLMYYEADGQIVYNGAYKMKLSFEREALKTPGKLEAFLCWQLASQITVIDEN
jgi:hypothetical protein